MNKKQAISKVHELVTTLESYGVISSQAAETLAMDLSDIIDGIALPEKEEPVWKNHPSAQSKTKKSDLDNVTLLWEALKSYKKDDEGFH
jgi:hypothetical protein